MIRNHKPDSVVIIIDLENRECCPPQFAMELEQEIHGQLVCEVLKINVIIKVRKFENWLIADLNGVGSLNQFNVSKSIKRSIEPNKADHVDAVKIFQQMSNGYFDKIGDGKRISNKVTPQNIARHSRSFRRCLRVIGVQHFQKQSKNPSKNYN